MLKITLEAIKLVLEEEPLNDPKLTRERIATCEGGCVKFNSKKRKCRGCGCYIDIKAEMLYNYNPKKLMRVERTHCPEGLWPDSDLKIINYYKRLDKEPLLKK